MIPILLHQGPLTIHSYGLMMWLGIFAAGVACTGETFHTNQIRTLPDDKAAQPSTDCDSFIHDSTPFIPAHCFELLQGG